MFKVSSFLTLHSKHSSHKRAFVNDGVGAYGKKVTLYRRDYSTKYFSCKRFHYLSYFFSLSHDDTAF